MSSLLFVTEIFARFISLPFEFLPCEFLPCEFLPLDFLPYMQCSLLYNFYHFNATPFGADGPSIKYYFGPILSLLPLSHFVTHPWTPQKYYTHIGPPIFSRPSTKIPDKSPLYKFSLYCSRGFLTWGFCILSERCCPGWFLSVPPSVRIHLLQQNVKH